MKQTIKGKKKIQVVWWGLNGFTKRWGIWAYPRSYKAEPVFKGKPIFYGLLLGLIEIRYFPNFPNS